MLLADGLIDLRLGRWQDVLADVETCDSLITDPPFSARTHEGVAMGATIRGLARQLGVSSSTLVRAVNGVTWRHVKAKQGGLL